MNRKVWVGGLLAVALVLAGAIGHALWSGRSKAPETPPPVASSPQPPSAPPEAQAPAVASAPETVAPAPATTAPAAPPTPPAEMVFQRLAFDTSGERMEACLEFNQRLTDALDVHYADYLRFRPPVASTLRVDGNRLCIGGLAYGIDYTATVLAGLPALSGLRTAAEETVPVSMADRPPLITFEESGFILPRSGTGVGVQTINVDKLKISVLRIGDRQVFRYLDRLRSSWGYSNYGIESLKNDVATVVWSGEMDIQNRRNAKVVTSFPIAQALPERKPGIYVVTAEKAGALDENDDSYRDVATQFLVDTDIALSTLTGADGLHILVRSLETAKPLPGVTVTLIARGNDELAKAVSDEAGRVSFAPGLLRGEGGARPATVMAFGPGDNFAVLDLGRPAFDLSDRGVSGRDMPGAFDAYLYSDRGIYRPGETVHMATLLRDQQARAVDDVPLTLVVNRPNGGEFKRFALKEPKAGAFLLDFDLPDTAGRGLWSAGAFVDPAGQPVGRIEFDVQDFVPQRLKVTATLAADVIEPSKPVNLAVDGQFLYGAPAAGLSGEVLVRVEKNPQPFTAADGYVFGLLDDAFRSEDYEFTIDETDPQGHADLSLELNNLPPTSLPLRARIDTGLFEPGGRSTRTQSTVPLRTAARYVGIRPLFGNSRVRLDTEAAFEIQAFDADGRPVAAQQLDYSFIREVVTYDHFYNNGRWSYVSSKRDRRVDSGTVAGAADKPATLSLRPDWGSYRIEVKDRQSGAVTSLRFSSGWQATAESVERPDVIEMAVDKPLYRAGDTVRVNVKPPFAGELTLVVATDRVHELRHLTVPAEGAAVDFRAAEEWGPGAYMLASIQRPVGQASSQEPVRAVGIAWAGLDQSERKLSVAIEAPEVTRPRSRLSLPVTVNGAAGETVWLTLAAVDEGVLQLTRFRSPDPDSYYFSKRRLGLELRDDYGRLLDGKAGPAGPIRAGGDALGGRGLPVVPTRTVALFSGVVAVDGNGRATIDFDVPDFAGQLRLMAVAFGKTRVGHGEGRVFVRDPVVAEVSLPRFLAPGDTGSLTLMVHNVEGQAGAYTPTLQTDGPLAFDAPVAPTYELAADGRRTESFPLRGTVEGIGTIRLALTGPGGFAVQREWQIAVRSPWLPITLEMAKNQAPGETLLVEPRLLDAFVPGSATVAVNYSLTQGLDFGGLLQSLWRYPYGCTEQTVSVAMPLLYVDDPALIAASREPGRPAETKAGDAATLRQRVQRAIDTVIDRQDDSGDIGLWRAGDGQLTAWLTVYTVDFLTRAKERGYVVPDHALRVGRQALSRIANGGGDVTNAQAYAFLALARQRGIDIGSVRYFHDTQLTKLTGALAPAQLGAALALMGDRGRSANAFTAAARHLRDAVPKEDYYATPLRNLAAAVAAGAEAGASAYLEQTIPPMLAALRPLRDLNTLEKASLTLAAAAMTRDGQINLAVNDLVLAGGQGVRSLAPSLDEMNRGYRVTNVGDRALWSNLVVHGTPLSAPPALSAGVEIRKSVFNLKGQPVDPTQIRQNDRVIVKVEGRLLSSAYRQLVIVDMLPTGLETEAPVTTNSDARSDNYPWLGELSSPHMRELRDDRVVGVVEPDTNADQSAGELPKDGFALAYIARAVTPGSYALPGVAVEDMYNPAIMARSATGHLTVAPAR